MFAWPSKFGQSTQGLLPKSAASISAGASIRRRSMRCGRRSTATPCWCFTISASMTRNCVTSRLISARSKSAGRPPAAGGGVWHIPRSATSPTLDEDGRLRQRDDGRRLDSLGNRLWHTDASYMPVPVVLGMLHAVTVPPASALGGGETEFADMRGAYDALSEALKAERRARRRTRRLLVARPDRLYRVSARRARAVPAVAAAAGTPSSRLATQDALSLGARLAHRRLAGSRGASATPRSQHPRHPTGIRLQPQVAGRRSGNLGQPLHDASWPAARRLLPAGPAPRDNPRHRLDLRRSRLTSQQIASSLRASQ